jgi:hypothetical protein
MTASASALAQVPEGCRANYGEIDLCGAARTITDHIAPTLPVRLAADMHLTTITATGRRIIMSATWGLTEAQFREQLTTRHITAEQFAAHLERLTKRLACSSKPEAAFVTLGGEIELPLCCKRRVHYRGAGHHKVSLRRGPGLD